MNEIAFYSVCKHKSSAGFSLYQDTSQQENVCAFCILLSNFGFDFVAQHLSSLGARNKQDDDHNDEDHNDDDEQKENCTVHLLPIRMQM